MRSMIGETFVDRYSVWEGRYERVITSREGKVVIAEEQTFSSCVYTGTRKVATGLTPTYHVLCVGYKAGDMQIAVTGSVKEGESCREAAEREIQEEVGIVGAQVTYVTTTNHQNKTVEHYTLYLSEMPALTTSCPKVPEGSDDWRKKVSIIIYGPEDVMIRLMQAAKATDPKESITYYAIMPLSVAMRALLHIEK